MKDLKISKELLGSVMEFKKQNVYSKDLDFIRLNENNIQFAFKTEHNIQSVFSINIYEFAFKCKEWAFKKGYEIHTNFNEVVAVFKEVRKIENVGHFKRLPLISWEEIEYDRDTNNEVEAIIKACEWILENE